MIASAVLLLYVALANCALPPAPEVYEIRESPYGRLYIVDKNNDFNREESPLLKLIKMQNPVKRKLNDKQLDYLADAYKGTNVEDIVYKLIDRLREIRQGSDQANRYNDARIAINYDDNDDDSYIAKRENKLSDMRSDIIYLAPGLRSRHQDRTALPRHYNDYAND